jgi:hypothetical protein
MKKHIYSLLVALMAVSTFAASPAKANDLPCDGNNPYTSCGTPGGNTLPINKGTLILLIAGLVIGIVAVNRYKAAQYKVNDL